MEMAAAMLIGCLALAVAQGIILMLAVKRLVSLGDAFIAKLNDSSTDLGTSAFTNNSDDPSTPSDGATRRRQGPEAL